MNERIAEIVVALREYGQLGAPATEELIAEISRLSCEVKLKDDVIEAIKALTWHPKMLRDEKVKRLGKALKALRSVSEEQDQMTEEYIEAETAHMKNREST